MIKKLLIEWLPDTDSDFPIPEYSTSGSAGLDIRAFLSTESRSEGILLLPGQISLVSSGFKIEIPQGHEGQIRARSGLSLNHGITVANGVGTIDSDYRGPIGVLLINLGQSPYTIMHGCRIAQLVIAKYSRVKCEVVKNISQTKRNESGFGSTGDY